MTWRTEALYLICNVIVIQFLLDKYFLDTSGPVPGSELHSAARPPTSSPGGKFPPAALGLLPRFKQPTTVQLPLLLAALLLPVMVLTPLLSDPAEDALFPKLYSGINPASKASISAASTIMNM